jgi:hypothetical protein
MRGAEYILGLLGQALCCCRVKDTGSQNFFMLYSYELVVRSALHIMWTTFEFVSLCQFWDVDELHDRSGAGRVATQALLQPSNVRNYRLLRMFSALPPNTRQCSIQYVG